MARLNPSASSSWINNSQLWQLQKPILKKHGVWSRNRRKIGSLQPIGISWPQFQTNLHELVPVRLQVLLKFVTRCNYFENNVFQLDWAKRVSKSWNRSENGLVSTNRYHLTPVSNEFIWIGPSSAPSVPKIRYIVVTGFLRSEFKLRSQPAPIRPTLNPLSMRTELNRFLRPPSGSGQ